MYSDRINEWRKGKALADLKKENPYIFNSWRAIKYTKKGKNAGYDSRWDSFENFYDDMAPDYREGLILCRIDKNLPFSKDNCRWLTSDEVTIMKPSTVVIEYDGRKLSIKEWAQIAETTYNAIKNRYYKHPEYTPEEWIFGKKKKRNSKPAKDWKDSESGIRSKASKMISAYKCKDKKNGVEHNCDIDIDWMVNNIIMKPCIYCGDTKRIGCDRIDNSKGHTKDNVVPCCYECNCARNNNFSFDEMKIIGKAIREVKEARNG